MSSPKSAETLSANWQNSLALLKTGWRRFLTTNRNVWVKVGMHGIYAALWLDGDKLLDSWQADA